MHKNAQKAFVDVEKLIVVVLNYAKLPPGEMSYNKAQTLAEDF